MGPVKRKLPPPPQGVDAGGAREEEANNSNYRNGRGCDGGLPDVGAASAAAAAFASASASAAADSGAASADGNLRKRTASEAAAAAPDDDDDDDDEGSASSSFDDEGGVEGEGREDPFPFLLKPQPLPGGNERVVLWWHSPAPHLPRRAEERLLKGNLLRWGDTERGMMKDQPAFRQEEVRKLCRRERVPLPLALSLRRHHMKDRNPRLRMPALRLGSEADIRESAEIFERCVDEFLRSHKVEFWTEGEQRKHNRPYLKGRTSAPHHRPPSPDFVLKYPIRVKRFYYKHSKNDGGGGGGGRGGRGRGGKNNQQRQHQNHQKQQQQKSRAVTHEQDVGWVEAKMFYGASTIQHDNKSAVGCLLRTARKYVRTYGPGAMVFMHGCGDELATQLADVGVIALDCGSRETVNLGPVHAHQSTWCADSNGQILP